MTIECAQSVHSIVIQGLISVAQRIFLRAHTSLSASKGIDRAASEGYQQVEAGFPAIFTSGTRNDTFSI